MKLASNTGMLLLGIWLVLYGLAPLLHLDFQALPLLMNLLAIAAGYQLDTAELVYSTRGIGGAVQAAMYTDVTAQAPAPSTS